MTCVGRPEREAHVCNAGTNYYVVITSICCTCAPWQHFLIIGLVFLVHLSFLCRGRLGNHQSAELKGSGPHPPCVVWRLDGTLHWVPYLAYYTSTGEEEEDVAGGFYNWKLPQFYATLHAEKNIGCWTGPPDPQCHIQRAERHAGLHRIACWTACWTASDCMQDRMLDCVWLHRTAYCIITLPQKTRIAILSPLCGRVTRDNM